MPNTYADAVKCASVPTQSILFNIDKVASGSKDKTVILRVFAILRRADNQLQQKREALKSAGSLTQMDAMIPQAQSIQRNVCRQLAALVDTPLRREGQAVQKERVAYLSRRELCTARRLGSAAEIDLYIKGIRERLEAALAENDVVVVSD